jgi:hypothetical protein
VTEARPRVCAVLNSAADAVEARWIVPTKSVAPVPAEDLSPEQRWDVWIAKGVEDDRKFQTRALVAASTLAIVTAIGLYLFR